MRVPWLATAAFLALTGCATLSGDASAPQRYLPKSAFDARDHVPPPPARGSPLARKDREIFVATRALKDTPRWSLAQADNAEENILGGYACALGYTPTRETNPKLAAMMLRMSRDVRSAVAGPKMKYRRARPYLGVEAPICIKRSVGLAVSPDYPSGHATWGWTVGLLLSEVAPDRSNAILARARAYGESRVICGVHNASAVEAGKHNAETLFAALWSSEAFKADLAAARAESDEVRAKARPLDPARCTSEANLVGAPLF